MNFYSILDAHRKTSPVKPAIIFRDKTITFAELFDAASGVANGLSRHGVKKSDTIAIFLPNTPEYVFSLLGIFLMRGIIVPLDFMLTQEELVTFIKHSEAKILIAQEKKGVDYKGIQSICPSLKTIVLLQQGEAVAPFVNWEAFTANCAAVPPVCAQEDDNAAIFYTSGSTGHPKGVVLTYAHLQNPGDCFKHFLEITSRDILLCAGVPFSHLGGVDHMLLMLHFGVTMVLMDRFMPLEFLRLIEKYKISIFCIVPAMYVAVLSMKEFDQCDLTSLRYAVVFGAPSAPALLARFHKACPKAYLLNGWGMTETAAPNAYLPTGTNAREIAGTGKFQPGLEAKLVDDAGNVLTGEADGELWLRGKPIMVEYYKEPELTRDVLTSQGWLKTGDICHRDGQDRYSIVGRKKEMIKVAGEIVFCPEVEEAIHRHEHVLEVAVIGVPDSLRGEVPKAFIVVKAGESLNPEGLRAFLRTHLAHFKIPHHYVFVPQLPKNRVGKIDKEQLKRSA